MTFADVCHCVNMGPLGGPSSEVVALGVFVFFAAFRDTCRQGKIPAGAIALAEIFLQR